MEEGKCFIENNRFPEKKKSNSSETSPFKFSLKKIMIIKRNSFLKRYLDRLIPSNIKDKKAQVEENGQKKIPLKEMRGRS